MSTFTNIVKKELHELMTKSTILPIVMMALMFGLLGNVIGNVAEEATAKPVIGLIDQDSGAMSDVASTIFYNMSDVAYNGTSVDEGLSLLQNEGAGALIVIPANFTQNILSGQQGSFEVYWILKGSGIADTIPSGTTSAVIAAANNAISSYLINQNASINASLALSPTRMTQSTMFVNTELDGVSPTEIQSMMSSQAFVVPLAISMIIMMAGGTVISSMALEKENKTLETLLTLPVSRTSVITGKLTASAIVGLLMAGIYMVGFGFYMSSISGSSSVDLAGAGLQLGIGDYLLVGASMFAALMAALALCMVIGTFASNYKSAQSLTMPVVILAMIPMFVTMFKDYGTLPVAGQVFMFGIPFAHPMMAIRSLMFDEYAFVVAGIIYSVVFAVVMIAIASWIFKTDRLLTGRMGKKAHSKGKGIGIPSLVGLLAKRRAESKDESVGGAESSIDRPNK